MATIAAFRWEQTGLVEVSAVAWEAAVVSAVDQGHAGRAQSVRYQGSRSQRNHTLVALAWARRA